MEEIGQGRGVLVAAALLCGGAALAVVSLACVWAWPFAIDDAFIGVRYARHLAAGVGYVWNVGAQPTDGVTPLPWAPLIAPLAHPEPIVVLRRVKLAGAIVWTLTAAAWGAAVGRAKAPPWAKACVIALLAVDVPVAAHAVSGMETALATALATLAALLHRRPRAAATLAGLAATLRPELVVWSVVVAVGFERVRAFAPSARGDEGRPSGHGLATARSAVIAGSVAALPFVACAVLRVVVFGRPAPLAVLAKPSDLAHGFVYAGAAAIFSLAPLLAVSPVALARERGPALVLVLAALGHFAVVCAVGGDWMPYARLVVPVVPSLLLAFVLAAPHAVPWVHAARAALAFAVAAWLVPGSIRALRQAGEDRSVMIEQARPLLASAERVAAVDIGWLSAVSEGTVIDLAGVTDPDVAVLGGGHTSKRISPAFLSARGADTAVFFADPLPATLDAVSPAAFPRVVERRLADADAFAGRFAPAALLPLGRRGAGYVIFRRR